MGCSLSPAQRIQKLADQQGFSTDTVSTSDFDLVLFKKPGDEPGAPVHIYIEGDGTPWLHNRFVAADPTSHNPIALKLMAQDAAPALYLSRPCYQGTSRGGVCRPKFWTSARYGATVVDNMAFALRKILTDYVSDASRQIVLIGYSGGGTLALLLANSLPEVNTVVTVAANIDPDAWAQMHGYLPLTGSVNPSEIEHWRPELRQIHLMGKDDSNIPPGLSNGFFTRSPQAERRIFEGFNHHCCWIADWPDILQSLELNR